MKISVVMTSYNGEPYIVQQLESLKEQTRKPDEVLILDDCSKDSTIAILKEYIRDNALENWKVVENNHNVGWRKNFFDGISIAQGELIFTCDQDDCLC